MRSGLDLCAKARLWSRLNIDVKVKWDEDEENEQTGSKIHQNKNFRINQQGRTLKLSESLSLQKASSSNCQASVRENANQSPKRAFLFPLPFSRFSTLEKNKKLEILMWNPATRVTAIKTASLWVYMHRHWAGLCFCSMTSRNIIQRRLVFCPKGEKAEERYALA